MDFKEIKDVAEFIYYLSWPVVIFGIRATWLQLKAFNQETKTRFKRESIMTSIEVLERKLDQIETSYLNAFEHSSTADTPEHNISFIGYSKASNTIPQSWLDWYENNDQIKFKNHITDSLNHMETLSQYIFSGVADEDMCYKLEHTMILGLINDMMIYLVESRSSEDDMLYEGIVNLHQSWTARLHHDTSLKELTKAQQNFSARTRPKSKPVLGIN